MSASALLLLVLVVGLVVWMWFRKSGRISVRRLNSTVEVQRVSRAGSGTAVQTKIAVDGREYSSPEEMPSDVRRSYEQTMNLFGDKDRDGVPDLLEGDAASKILREDVHVSGGDPVQRLKTLKEMREAALITEQEYEAAKAAILSDVTGRDPG